MAENNKGVVAGALLLVAGGIIGAGLALLYAPQSGSRTRRDIARYGKKVRRKADEAAEQFATSVSEMVKTVSEQAEGVLEKGQDMTQEARKEVIKVLEQGQERLEKQRSRLMKLVGKESS